MDNKMCYSEFIEKFKENICDNFCCYRDTVDDDCMCDWIRSGEHECPLDRL